MRKKGINDGEAVGGAVKFKALDVVILILILTAVVGVYFRYNILDTLTGSKNLKDYVVSFEINNVQYKTENYINIGDKVYYSNGDELGTLIEASDNAKMALIPKPTTINYLPYGELQAVELTYPENTRIDAQGRIQCKGRYTSESGFLHNGNTPVSVGDRISVKTELVTVEITVTNIAVAE